MKLVKFYHLPLKEKLFFAINFFLLGVARLLTKLFNYRKISFLYGHFCYMTLASTILNDTEVNQAKRVARRIKLVSRHTPWRSNCLTKALVVRFWCAVYRIPYMFYIGFSKNSDAPMGRRAHAWVVAGPVCLTGGDGFLSHVVTQSYSSLRFKNKSLI